MAGVAICSSLVTLVFDQLRPGEPGFPRRLSSVSWKHGIDVRGSMVEGPAISIVGARAASRAAMQRAHAIAKHCASHRIHVVSGGALGIDGAAHRGALAGNGTTTTVLGSGIDIAYPARHAPLFDQIVARGGAVISMFPPGTEPRPATFPQRNRLIAALGDLVLVIEADVRSGSLSTARAARELGRVLAACPGSRGCDRLLADGAAVVEHGDDALAALAGELRMRPPVALDPIAARIASAIESGARGVDAIVRHTGLSVRDVLRALPTIDAANARTP
jgi:DNA processing protein